MSATQEHTVRVPRGRKKRYGMVKFASGTNIDFVKLSQTPVKIERENNLKDYKLANDLDTQPKFGAGSEYGKDLKEEARRKKYGKILKQYNPEDQPWQLKVGAGKQVKRYKGVREGTISDNTSYYIFMQCADGAFEAVPIEEWYNFQHIPKYKYLNSDEAEEEFNRRDKTLNMFSIMLKKRINKEDDKDADLEEGEKKSKKRAKEKEFKLTDMDDWADRSDEDEDDADDEEDGEEKEDKKEAKGKKAKKGKDGGKKKKRNAKHNSDDEAVEESDEGDYDDREVDYISDSDSLSEPDEQTKEEKYEEKGVDEEHGLRKLIDSEESSDEENKEDENDEDKEKNEKEKKDGGSDSDSSSSSSASDSDIEKDEKINSALFMQKSTDKKRASPLTVTDKPGSRSTTPTNVEDKKAIKRKLEGDLSSGKKARTDSPVFNSQSGSSQEGITEESIRRYLSRKPMTAKELVLKFKSKKLNMSNEQMTSTIAQLLKKINPEKSTINNTMYLSLVKKD